MRANQESWFRSSHGEIEREREGLSDLGLLKIKENKRRKKPLELESLTLLLSNLGLFFFFFFSLVAFLGSFKSKSTSLDLTFLSFLSIQIWFLFSGSLASFLFLSCSSLRCLVFYFYNFVLVEGSKIVRYREVDWVLIFLIIYDWCGI